MNRDRIPWLVFIGANSISLSTFSITATAEKRQQDDDDLRVSIDSAIIKNDSTNAHHDWYWCEKILKGAPKIFKKDFDKNVSPIRIDLDADGTPVINTLEITVSSKETRPLIFTAKDVRPYTFKGVNDREDYNRFDTEIVDAANHWNLAFNDRYPPPELLHPNLVKAMIYVESRMGYFETGGYPSYPDVMQVANPSNPAIHALNNDGWRNTKGVLAQEREWKDGAIATLDYKNSANGMSSGESILWGTRWLYHCAQGITEEKTRYWKPWKEAVKLYNGGGNPTYAQEVYDVYLRGVDQRNNNHIKLFLLISFTFLSASFAGIFFGVYAIPSTQKMIQGEFVEPTIIESIEEKVRAVMDRKLEIYKKQNTYYYGDMFRDASVLCSRHGKQCSADYVFYPYFTDLVRYARSMDTLLEAAHPLDIVTAYNSSVGDFDNDGVNELVVVLHDELNHDYLDVLIIDERDKTLHRAQQKIDRLYSGGPPRVVDLTGDAIPEIIIFSTGGRQDIQAYIFQYNDGALDLVSELAREYLRSDIIFSDQNRNHIPEIVVRGEQYGPECMACTHKKIEEIFEYNSSSKKFDLLSSNESY